MMTSYYPTPPPPPPCNALKPSWLQVISVFAVLFLPYASSFSRASTCNDGSFTKVAAGYAHTCAITGGAVKCWGSNTQGQLGRGDVGDNYGTPQAVSGITNATAISAGRAHTCAILTGGKVKCWGWNTYGQLGRDTTGVSSGTPQAVSGITNATAIAAGDDHTCAITGGAVKCWGRNEYGELGRGDVGGNYGTPQAVSGITNATAIAAGFSHTCAILTGGKVKCWGWDIYGQLGRGYPGGNYGTPQATGITNATAIAAWHFHTCAITGGKVKCWGQNVYGQLGMGTTAGNYGTPQAVSGITNATAIAAGKKLTCAILTGGVVKCWGDNTYGQLGMGTTAGNYGTPQATGITNATAIAAGGYHTCAITGGAVTCWGWNNEGQLGRGTTAGNYGTPQALIASCPNSAGVFSTRLQKAKGFRSLKAGFRCIYQPPINPALRNRE